ncbi:MAG: UDP-N-acetylmuramoylalanine--D-glutamate ligase [Candidatus Edwardsbacteria bacterium RIFOXYD12_FULL_50_11]|uniref:UDP-N-acetylmuramoylalanine--D-glutamate ligase n=1 Tax=Candidatus Edwardsbacteria bacterium GWF2_54_11 TaxID=1817851 RepID=A0A1F5REN0_9BACT|nr:MAG: UDP-N-acetylmuramoylalanine--D-glutamate ligase [Candidatus Edwardsbacteria bacterium RifOxyC12_full_54_24]OGF09012.1 MAG: UDP-N-acetylmuramoylalanine--D-glutamate ligase [Candidatus Edwardsbacteria bacterium RifOxyA12_full_54_48]OGF12459.1 MAG: UDP-N-acetylmuramoylalanine--D-glutamate ligase [Candidatus Edwardsbacteria bacterium GWE2_54_12]OGF12899.1 MAG: UDP-N-acetylmuramoylalanine--D-glutamate ligase [Candidatus Edwardsbacteria bacterium GWF2_54_11]OGF17436.1 MAG: UDP-N-acetylmuramoy
MKLDLANKKVSVVGLARSGMAAVGLLKKSGADVFASDFKSIAPEELKELDGMGVAHETGGHTEKLLDSQMIVISPGVRADIPILQRAARMGIEVIGEIELAYRAIESRIIAVTGTNGKSTTVSMIGSILKNAGKDVHIGGNLAPGRPLCQLAGETRPDSIIVAEVSTFQIETIKTFKPYIGVVTNISPDHLDRHPDFESYARLKGELLKNQDETDHSVLNLDDLNVQKYCSGYRGSRLGFSLIDPVEKGSWWDGRSLYLAQDKKSRKILDTAELKIPGKHNISNALAAIAAASVLDVPSSSLASGLASFRGVPHRLEEVATVKGIRYINNSMCTNNDAGISSLRAFDVPLVVIAGGKEKGTDLSGFVAEISQRARAAVLIGEARERLKAELDSLGFSRVVLAGNMSDAVKLASQQANAGDAVILAPGCASFDMFRDFEDRGEQFKQAVHNLGGG